MTVPILQGEETIVRRDANRTFASAKYRDILTSLLFKARRKFGDYQQSLSYMAGFLLLFYDMGTVYKMLTILNNSPKYLSNYWRGENVQCNIDGWVLFDILPHYLPTLDKEFKSKMIQPNILALSQKWFGGCLIQNIPCPYLLDIMDGFFNEGVTYIFRTALSILKVTQPLMLTLCKNMDLSQMQGVCRLLGDQKHKK
eukprot:UN31895